MVVQRSLAAGSSGTFRPTPVGAAVPA